MPRLALFCLDENHEIAFREEKYGESISTADGDTIQSQYKPQSREGFPLEHGVLNDSHEIFRKSADFKAVQVKALKVIEVARNGKAVEVSLIMVWCASLVGHGDGRRLQLEQSRRRFTLIQSAYTTL